MLKTLNPHKQAEDLADFISASPTSYQAVASLATRLRAAGFSQLDEAEPWEPGSLPAACFVIRDGALLAWVRGAREEPGSPYRILGAHTDSPAFKVKPQPSISSLGWQQVGVEIYGGPLLSSWLDRELKLAGRVSLARDAGRVSLARDGGTVSQLIHTGPLARIPHLAIHLDRSQQEQLTLDKQKHLYPIWAGADQGQQNLLDYLGQIDQNQPFSAQEVVGFDLFFADAQAPGFFGAQGEFLAATRLDNLSSVHAGLTALERYWAAQAQQQNQASVVLAAFDHEEIGSSSRSGAAGSFLEDILVRLSCARGEDSAQYRQSLARSVCLSSDAGHLVHPNYAGHHDPVNQPRAGAGPLLKINANQRYATDSVGAGIFALACRQVGAPYQEFVSHNSIPCGSTIGPITATRLGIRTVDVGLGLLSMHSAREMCHIADQAWLSQVIEGFFLA